MASICLSDDIVVVVAHFLGEVEFYTNYGSWN